MGYPGQPDHPAVVELMARAARDCKLVGKPIGTVGDTPGAVVRYRAAGFDYLAIGSDLGLLMRAAQGATAALRTQGDDDLVHTLAEGTTTERAG
jgi:2-dehydro-3-deoxyglucarate aldolase